MVFLYHPVQCSKAVSEAVKGILKGRNSSFSNLHTLVRMNNETIIDETVQNRSTGEKRQYEREKAILGRRIKISGMQQIR